MTEGITYVRGRVDGETTESASLARVSGQFTVFESCPIRAASSHRVQLDPTGWFTPNQGALIFYFDTDNAFNGAGQGANGRVFEWRLDASNLIEAYFDKSGGLWTFKRRAGGANSNLATVAGTQNADAGQALLVQWTTSTLQIAVNGGPISSVANSLDPGALPATLDVGRDVAGTNYLEAAFGAVAAYSAPLTAAQWAALANLRAERPPLMGERADGAHTGLWFGGHHVVWTLATTGDAIDLNDRTANDLWSAYLQGAGLAPIRHRAVETPLRHGMVPIDSLFQARRMSLLFRIISPNAYAALFDLRRQVIAALNPVDGAGVLMYAPAATVYEIDAMVDQEGIPLSEAIGIYHHTPSIPFVCHDPMWRYGLQQRSSLAVPLAGWSIPWSIPWTITEAALSAAIDADSDLPVYPEVVITAGAAGLTTPSVQNVTTGKLFRLEGLSLAAAEVMTIDLDDRTAEKSDGTNVFGYRSSASRAWALERGSNSVKAAVEAGSGTFEVRYWKQLAGV